MESEEGRFKDNIFVERTWRTLKYEWLFLKDYRAMRIWKET
mgnify:CR=1 FL=1